MQKMIAFAHCNGMTYRHRN